MIKRIPIPPDACSLDGAICLGISMPHRAYGTCPAGEGVEPCLFELTQSNGTSTLEGALIVPPTETAGRIFATRFVKKSYSEALQKALCQGRKGSAEAETAKAGGID